jgi:hypothetical protein
LKLIRIYLLLLIVLSVQVSRAQKNPSSLSNLRSKYINTNDRVITLDSLSIVPGTIIMNNVLPSAYKIDAVNATITWLNKPLSDSVKITYRIFPYKLNAVVRHYNFDSVQFNFISGKPLVNYYNDQPGNVLNFGDVNSAGSFGRGISFGNAQNAVLSSSFNLQLSGYIGDSLFLTAAITDDNIPIQPDGNTQNLNDFDKVFLQIKKRGWQLALGDIDLRQSKSYFLNFYQRLQGADFTTDNRINKDVVNSLTVSGSVAKGKFTQNIVTPIEGDQGPYHLQDPNNDIAFTVLAGTEKVFLDGQLLQRGQDQDYVIDYNTAEITFTPKIMITINSRIQVDFEYADRSYLNSNLYVNDDLAIKNKLILSIGAFSNQDAKNSPINQPLDSSQTQFLSNIGSNIANAYYPSATLDTFSSSMVQYKKIDTVYNTNIQDSIYEVSINPSDTLYSLGFTNVGAGNGNYIQILNTASNGQAFQWVAPDINNVKQGNWEPVVLLVTPKKQQMVMLGAEYLLDKHTDIKTEFAVSDYDVNLLSTKDKGDDIGTAAKLSLVNKDRRVNLFNTPFKLETQLGYEFEQQDFKPLERLHNIEFDRDWSLSDTVHAADEHLANAGFILRDVKGNNFQYNVTSYNRSDSFNGIRQQLQNVSIIKGWRLSDQLSVTTTTYGDSKDAYIRPTVDLVKALPGFKNLLIGFNYTGEHNKLQDKATDTLSALSFAFDQWQASVKSDPKKLNNWGVSFFTRNDFLPSGAALIQSDRSNNISIYGELAKSKKNQLRFNLTYRKLNVTDTLLTTQRNDQSLLGRVEYLVNEWKGFLKGTVLYELGAGQEQKLQYTYLQVPAGQGQYQWIDYNGDGVAELNEFVLAQFQDQANYIRVLTPSGLYVKANYIQFNYSVELNPKAIINTKTTSGIAKLLMKTTTSSTLQIDKKQIAAGGFDFDPFTKTIVDTSLISLNSFLSNTLYFNRTDPKWGFDISHNINNNKSLYTYGVESHIVRNLQLKTRWNVSRNILANFDIHTNKDQLITPAFDNSNYDLNIKGVSPSLSYIYKTNVRFTFSYDYNNRTNTTGYNDKAVSNALSTDLKYNILSSSLISAHFEYNNIRYTSDSSGSQNTTVGYIMLGGLVPGANYLWTLSYTKRLAGNIEMTLEYDARKPGSEELISTGKASVRALF